MSITPFSTETSQVEVTDNEYACTLEQEINHTLREIQSPCTQILETDLLSSETDQKSSVDQRSSVSLLNDLYKKLQKLGMLNHNNPPDMGRYGFTAKLHNPYRTISAKYSDAQKAIDKQLSPIYEKQLNLLENELQKLISTGSEDFSSGLERLSNKLEIIIKGLPTFERISTIAIENHPNLSKINKTKANLEKTFSMTKNFKKYQKSLLSAKTFFKTINTITEDIKQLPKIKGKTNDAFNPIHKIFRDYQALAERILKKLELAIIEDRGNDVDHYVEQLDRIAKDSNFRLDLYKNDPSIRSINTTTYSSLSRVVDTQIVENNTTSSIHEATDQERLSPDEEDFQDAVSSQSSQKSSGHPSTPSIYEEAEQDNLSIAEQDIQDAQLLQPLARHSSNSSIYLQTAPAATKLTEVPEHEKLTEAQTSVINIDTLTKPFINYVDSFQHYQKTCKIKQLKQFSGVAQRLLIRLETAISNNQIEDIDDLHGRILDTERKSKKLSEEINLI